MAASATPRNTTSSAMVPRCVERYLREVMIPRIAPISPQLILSFIAERVLGLPKSY
jgi:alkylation response protein AidB-like acyl-CoA dehydrogenase